MKGYLWEIEYEALSLFRQTRRKEVVTNVREPLNAINIFKSGMREQEEIDFIRRVEYLKEIIK